MIQEYIEKVSKRLQSGISREHSYRGDLETLIRELVTDVEITNEPANVTDCGNPDYVITNGKIPVGYIEAKDIGKDLNSKQYKEQFGRYKKALDNLIITDYIWFQFFQNGELVHEIKIGEIEDNCVKPLADNFSEFENLIKNFCTHIGQTIKSSKKLAVMMASKARLLQNIIERAITSDEETQENTSLKGQYETFKEILIHDLNPQGFADIYSQTLAYGMFAARLHDKTLDDFSRQEAAELIPKSNPFLRKLFGYVAGPDIDERIVRTVDNLADVFRATNVEQLLQNFGKSTQTNDPIIHFYETFLAEYDPKLRKARGVWYTPEPVVNFIVRAVDDILKTEFNLPQGLADTTKTKIKVEQQGKMVEQEVHKVQILDPATGTGTFLAEVVKFIYNKKFKTMQGAWSSYVDEHLIPRLNGFELLMASYAMAHLKLDMLLRDTGYNATKNQRLNIYLTNSLEEHHPDTGTLFSSWLSDEANEANHIKRDTPVMCVIGNPPYAVSSSNKSAWINELMKDYKKNLNERNIQPLSDDYIKFIRYGQYFINKNGEGILAYISNNSFIDGIIHRQMRKDLLETFDDIYILDLHGNAKKKEKHPDGSADQNVFDIMQGVSINIFVKKTKSKKLGNVKQFDLYGKRDLKYHFFNDNSLSSINWSKLENRKPELFFVKMDWKVLNSYSNGINLKLLFTKSTSGIKTHCDKELVSFQPFDLETNHLYNYKPFDYRYINYDLKKVQRHRFSILKNVYCKDNIGFALMRKTVDAKDYNTVLLSKTLIDINYYGFQTYYFPLYLYPDQESEGLFTKESRTPNLNLEIVEKIAKKLGLKFVPEKETSPGPSKGGENGVSGQGFSENNSPSKGGWNGVSGQGFSESSISSPPLEGLGEVKVWEVKEVKPGYVTAKPASYSLIKKMRDELKGNPTEAEKIMWEYLRGKKTGYKIRRQHIVDNFITDFICLSKKLVIEIDGKVHLKQKEYDELRTTKLNELGYETIRFTNEEVFNNPEAVTQTITEKLNNKSEKETSPGPSKGGENGVSGQGFSENNSPSKVGENGVSGQGFSESSISSPPLEGLGEVTFAPIDILDYIYAVLHSPKYREKYKEFLKIDFPRVPYPSSAETFWKLVKLGGEIRQIHLLESPKVEEYITSYPIDGDNKVTTKIGKKDWELISPPLEGPGEVKEVGRIWINETQYFENIPLTAWEFYIGGYQPAQKWLKDRKARVLSFEDILHYQKIIVALTETGRLMGEIDVVGVE